MCKFIRYFSYLLFACTKLHKCTWCCGSVCIATPVFSLCGQNALHGAVRRHAESCVFSNTPQSTGQKASWLRIRTHELSLFTHASRHTDGASVCSFKNDHKCLSPQLTIFTGPCGDFQQIRLLIWLDPRHLRDFRMGISKQECADATFTVRAEGRAKAALSRLRWARKRCALHCVD